VWLHALDALTSLKLTIVCLSALMVLVLACTLAQVKLGTWPAVDRYIRAWVVWGDVPGTQWQVVVFPGGALVGLVLGLNLIVAQWRRLELSWRKAGLWIVHAGLVLLFVGEFVTGAFQVETNLAVREGETVNFVDSPRKLELAVIDVTDASHDEVYGVPESRLRTGATVALPNTPVELRVERWFRNASFARAGPGEATPATRGVGVGVAVHEVPPVTRDDDRNSSAAFVTPVVGGAPQGTFLVSSVIGNGQSFEAGGRHYVMGLRSQREYLPFSLTLKDFRHDRYAGTEIPKNFSSLVTISNPATGENRDVLIYMNQPLRYAGKAFYQSSFGEGDTLSILQVVENPGWLIPYVSTVLVTVGLLVHFAITLRRSLRRRAAAEEGAPGAGREGGAVAQEALT
jgi:hypothetical protein